MHTYRKKDEGWQVFYDLPDEARQPVGPLFNQECEAAAYVSFLNGGRYCPDEIAPIFAVPVDEADDDSTHPDRPDMDYALEPKRARK